MITTRLLASTAIALVMCGAPVSAQMQQKGDEEKSAPRAGSEHRGQPSQKSTQTTEPKSGTSKGAERGERASGKGTATEAQEKSKGSAQTQEKGMKGSAETRERGKGSAQTQEKGERGKGSAQTQEKGMKGSAETQEKGARPSTHGQTQEKGTTKGTAQTREQEKGSGSAATQRRENGAKGSAQTAPRTAPGEKQGSAQATGGRTQLTEQQRTNLHQTILKGRDVNRATNVNFSVRAGARIPHSVRLAVLPAAVISLVPQYRDYRYVVVDDQICIVDPQSYEVVDVITAPGQTARMDNRGTHQGALMLTAEEKRIVLDNINLNARSTLALGGLAEGAPVPRDVRLQLFPERVVQEVPKLRDYKYFTAENRVAICDPQGTRVQLVIDAER